MRRSPHIQRHIAFEQAIAKGAVWPDAITKRWKLKRCFPEYDFFLNGDTEPFEGDYQILPICGVGGDEPGTLRVLDRPEQSVMMGIAAALKGFRPGRTPALN
ncbi:hypothetical protein NKG60_26425 [Mesorhizobium sp. M1428]|uniref:hypothetical protein n=1 Tax=unclassified Mesorhizobium TaxID=325217 RepID=UPI00333B9984